jgi:hypothetical protein
MGALHPETPSHLTDVIASAGSSSRDRGEGSTEGRASLYRGLALTASECPLTLDCLLDPVARHPVKHGLVRGYRDHAVGYSSALGALCNGCKVKNQSVLVASSRSSVHRQGSVRASRAERQPNRPPGGYGFQSGRRHDQGLSGTRYCTCERTGAAFTESRQTSSRLQLKCCVSFPLKGLGY